MCGITAIIALDGVSQKSLHKAYRERTEKEVYESLDKIRHRGPDSEHVWISDDNRVALGMNRLAINDLTDTGEQPFRDPTGHIHVIANGEIYTSPEDRAELASWYPFKGHSDCEVIIPLYLKYGPGQAFLSRLCGEYAFVLYDARRRLVIAARDRYGIKPLFWTEVSGRLLFSSEAKGFLPLGWKPEWDVRSIMDEGWQHDERTLFKKVYKIRAGYAMICTAFDYIQHRQYWDMEYPDKRVPEPRSEEEMIMGVRERIREAVRARLRADVPVGIYLSGGIDSSAVAGVAVSLLEEECKKQGMDLLEAKKRFKCFCVGFEKDTIYDETAIAEKTAKMLGLEFLVTRMDDEVFAQHFVDATYHAEHNNPDLNYVGKFALSDLARKTGYKVILTGEGSDEIFAGYSLFYADFLRERDLAVAGTSSGRDDGTGNLSNADREVKTVQTEAISRGLYKTLGMSRYDASVPVGAANAPNPMHELLPETVNAWRRSVNDCSFADQTPSLTAITLSPWTTQAYGAVDVRETAVSGPDARTLARINEKWHPLHTDLYLWAKSGLSNYLLTCLGDRMEMGHSVEGRPPFLDHAVTEYVNGLPPSVKIRYRGESGAFSEKWILREAVKPYVLDELYRRQKHPFTAPPTVKSGGAMHKVLSSLVTSENVEQLGFLDWADVEPHVNRTLKAQRNKVAELPDDFGRATRYVYTVAQWIVLAQRFGIPKAERPM